MRRRLSIASAAFAALALTTSSAAALPVPRQTAKPAAKEEAKAKPTAKPGARATAGKDRVDGTIESIDNAQNLVLVRVRPSGNLHQVLLSGQTVYTVQNKAGSIDALKKSSRVICLGQLNDKKQLAATRCDVREPK